MTTGNRCKRAELGHEVPLKVQRMAGKLSEALERNWMLRKSRDIKKKTHKNKKINWKLTGNDRCAVTMVIRVKTASSFGVCFDLGFLVHSILYVTLKHQHFVSLELKTQVPNDFWALRKLVCVQDSWSSCVWHH